MCPYDTDAPTFLPSSQALLKLCEEQSPQTDRTRANLNAPNLIGDINKKQ